MKAHAEITRSLNENCKLPPMKNCAQMKSREEVVALFRDKYAHLKTVYPTVGPFEEICLYQNPDGGWQMNFENCAAITLRYGDNEPYETHGAICARWYEEGGAYNEQGKPGRLGYPISDEMFLVQKGNNFARVSNFKRRGIANESIVWTAQTNRTDIISPPNVYGCSICRTMFGVIPFWNTMEEPSPAYIIQCPKCNKPINLYWTYPGEFG